MGKISRLNKIVDVYSRLEYSGDQVVWSHRVEKQLDRLPAYIRAKFHDWVETMMIMGFSKARKISGFHDEALKGTRQGQRSVRLNKAYRAIYIETSDGEIKILHVIEVNKHEY